MPKPRVRANGQGTAYKRGRTWTSRVVVGWKVAEDGHAIPIYRTKGGFQTKRAALAYCPDLLRAPKPKPKQTFQSVYELWLPLHEAKVSKSTVNCYKAAWKFFAPIYNAPFADIDLDDLQECLDECPNGRRTKENMKALAGLLMKYAIPRHLTDMNYAEFLDTGNEAKGTRPAFTHDQIKKIDEQIGITPHAEDVICLIYTGFRPTELFMLTKEDCRDGILYGGIKTEAGKNRAVPVSPRIKPYIDARMEQNSTFLFPKDDGTQMSAKYFRDTYFYHILAAAGIQEIPTPDHPAVYTPYSARHSFANLLKDAPGSDTDKAGLIGHASYKTTQKHYQSATLEAFKRIIDAL